MHFKDIEEGQLFYYPGDGYKYIKVKHPAGYVPAMHDAGEYGGIWFNQFTNREAIERSTVYEFEPFEDVLQIQMSISIK
jgi:hypothetical protein